MALYGVAAYTGDDFDDTHCILGPGWWGRDKHSVAIAFIVQGLSIYGETRERVCFARDDV